MEVWEINAKINRKKGQNQSKLKSGSEREKQRNRDTKSVPETEREIILCTTRRRKCRDLKRCEHGCIMSPSSSTLPGEGLISVITDV